MNRLRSDFMTRMSGIGAHEVIIEMPEGNLSIEDLPIQPSCRPKYFPVIASASSISTRIRAFSTCTFSRMWVRVRELPCRMRIPSLSHFPLFQPTIEGKVDSAPGTTSLPRQRSLFTDILHTEKTDGSRLVAENDSYHLFCPYASRFPFEMAIYPKRHHPDFTSCNPTELHDLAEIFRFSIQRLNAVLQKPGYNMLLHTAPLRRPANRALCQHALRLLMAYRRLSRASIHCGGI